MRKAIPNAGTFPVNEFGSQFDETVKPVEAHDKGNNTFLISDATSAFNRTQQDYVLKEIVHHFGDHLTTEEYRNKKHINHHPGGICAAYT